MDCIMAAIVQAGEGQGGWFASGSADKNAIRDGTEKSHLISSEILNPGFVSFFSVFLVAHTHKASCPTGTEGCREMLALADLRFAKPSLGIVFPLPPTIRPHHSFLRHFLQARPSARSAPASAGQQHQLMEPAVEELVQSIHRSPTRAVLYATGGASQATSWLLSVPGASNTVLEVLVPYSRDSLVDILGEVGRLIKRRMADE